MTPIVLVILLMILGLALIGIEILVLPGVGVIGFLGLKSILTATKLVNHPISAQTIGMAM